MSTMNVTDELRRILKDNGYSWFEGSLWYHGLPKSWFDLTENELSAIKSLVS
jgi:hypothetical protein